MDLNLSIVDADLIQRAGAGDEDAFIHLYRHYSPRIYRYALLMSGSEAMAADVTQEVFMLLLERNNGYDPARGTLGAYLYGIARYRLRNHARQQRWLSPWPEDPVDENSLAPLSLGTASDPMDMTIGVQMHERLWQAVFTLPVHYRETVILVELQDLDYAAAAALIGCPVGTIRSRLSRARELLANKLAELQQTEREEQT